jgi:hypothetical protein
MEIFALTSMLLSIVQKEKRKETTTTEKFL